jgi:hypothetical protein
LVSSDGVVLAWGAVARWRALAAELQVLGDTRDGPRRAAGGLDDSGRSGSAQI